MLKKVFQLLFVCSFLLGVATAANASLLFEASLKNGDYGLGTAYQDTGGVPPGGNNGIVDSSAGVKFISTEADGQSNAIINWVISDLATRTSFRNSGTVSFGFMADRVGHVTGSILGENYGYDAFRNGQGSFDARAYRIDNGDGLADDQVMLHWSTLHSGTWYYPYDNTNRLEYDTWYDVGYAWGGPDHDFEIWVNGVLISSFDLPAGVSLPWGAGSTSGTNFGLGCNHQRGYLGDYGGSAAGVTFSDISIWDEYRALGDTSAVPIPGAIWLLGSGIVGLIGLKRKKK